MKCNHSLSILIGGLISFTVLLLSGCQSLNRALAEKEAAIVEEFIAENRRLAHLEEKTLSWDHALEMMFNSSLEIREAHNRVITSKETIERVFLDLLPAVNLTASLSKAVGEIGDVNFDDVNFSVLGIVSIPGVINLRVRWYAATLEHIRSQWALEMRKRELTIRLYELFIRQRVLDQRERSLRFALLFEERSPFRQDLLGSAPELERQSREWALEREYDQLQSDLARILGSYDAIWRPLPATIPQIDYASQPLDLNDTDHVAVLLRKLQAIELEGARLRELGVQLGYWPDLNVVLSAPPLYQRSGGQTRRFDIDSVRVNLSSVVRLDTQLRTSYRLRSVRRQIAILHERLHLENTLTLQRLNMAHKSLELNRQQLALTEFRLRQMRDSALSRSLNRSRDEVERILVLEEQRAGLELERARLQSMFWMVDERRWPVDDFFES